jgi:hypothetical protein
VALILYFSYAARNYSRLKEESSSYADRLIQAFRRSIHFPRPFVTESFARFAYLRGDGPAIRRKFIMGRYQRARFRASCALAQNGIVPSQ